MPNSINLEKVLALSFSTHFVLCGKNLFLKIVNATHFS